MTQVRALFPVALRVISASRRRNALIAALVALSLVFYSAYAVFLDLTYRQSASLMDQLRLPGDLVLYMPQGIGAQDLAETRSLYWLRQSEVGLLAAFPTSLGMLDVLVLPAGGGQRTLDELGRVIDGGAPGTGPATGPGAGQFLLPVAFRGIEGAGIGDAFALGGAVMPGRPSPPPRLPASFVIAGYYEPADDWLAGPVLVVDQEQFAAAGRPTVLFMWCAHPESFLAPLTKWVQGRFIPAEVTGMYLAQRGALPLLLRPDTAQAWGRDLQRAIYFPAGEAMFLLYVFFAVGLFTLMILSFLDRRRHLAVMKTLGLTSTQIALVLYLEVAMVGLCGLAVGGAASAGLLAAARQVAGQDLRLSWWIVATGSAFGALSLVLSVWFPVGLARLATVANLLGGQPFHPFGYERRWSEGASQQGGRAGMGLGTRGGSSGASSGGAGGCFGGSGGAGGSAGARRW
jgi:hypothetical protein